MQIIREENCNAYTLYRYGYYLNNNFVLHRDDGPATETSDGAKYWYQHGLSHRLDGPAIERTGICIICGWYYNGEKADVYSQEEFEKWLKLRNF